jgi:VWFA-related protein
LFLGLVVDRSSSIKPVKRNLDKAVAQLLGAAQPADQAFLVTFADDAQLRVAMTKDRNRILNALAKTKITLGTRFYDALIDSFQYLSGNRQRRETLIVFSDGAEHYSSHSFRQLLNVAMVYGYPIYIVGYVGDDATTWREAGRREIRNQFEQLVNATGGKAFLPVDQKEYSSIARQILERLRYEYRFGIYNSGRATDVSSIQIRIRGDDSHRFSIRRSRLDAPGLDLN